MRRIAFAVAVAAAGAPAGGPRPASAGGGPDVIVVVPGSHLDVGFTDVPSKVLAARVRTLDQALDAAREDPEFRWTEEGGWVVHAWLEAHAADPERVRAMGETVRAGRVGVGACWVNPHAALFPRSLHHLFAFHEEVERAFGVRPRHAVLNDVPAYPEALVDAAAAAGVEGFLVGANLAFSRPLPAALVAGPFVWRSSSGASVVVSIDPDAYTAAFTRWGIDPATARFFAKDRFPGKDGLDLARASIDEMGLSRTGTVAVQQAFDNWGADAARRLPEFARAWNADGRRPRVVPGTAAAAFSAWPREGLPVREGEWGGEWEEVRAGSPHWTARLRHAADATPRSAPLASRLALATAMDHSGGLGGPWPGSMTEAQARAHALEWAAMLRLAVGEGPDRVLSALADRDGARREGRFPDLGRDAPALARLVDARSLSPRLFRAPLALGGPYFPARSPAADASSGISVEGEGDAVAATLWARLDRSEIPGDEAGIVDVGWDLPLLARAAEVRAWPKGAGAAAKGLWLRGTPPTTWIAPEGLVVETPAGRLLAVSEHAFAFRVVEVAGRARLQVLLVRQSRRCDLKGGARKVLPFEALYPGEPVVLGAELRLSVEPPR